MIIKAISFDLGNTLLISNSKKGIVEEILALFPKEKKGNILDSMKYHFMKKEESGFGCIREFCEENNCEDIYDRIIDTINRYIKNEIIALEKDATILLNELKNQGYILIALSNSFGVMRNNIYESELKKYFDYTFISTQCGLCKPEEELYILVEKTTGLKSSEIIHIGDSLTNDYFGALNAGWSAVLLDKSNSYCRIKNRITSLSEVKSVLTKYNMKMGVYENK